MNIPFYHFKRHPFKEVIKNMLLNVKAYYHYITYNNENRQVISPRNYFLVFKDEFKNKLNTDVWRYSQTWGDYHPNHLGMHYDNNGQLAYTSNQGLVLELKRKPRILDGHTIPNAVGLVNTKIGWQYGWFEGWIKLPKGQPYWLAFWLSGLTHWPPEIDIFEAYSHKGPLYDDYLLSDKWLKLPNQKIQPNLHYGVPEDKTYEQYGSFNIPVANVTDRFVQYVCHWEKDFIKIYYDGNLVFECRNPEVLKHYNGPTDQMHIILNHGVWTKGYENPDENPMIIKSIKVYQK